MVLLKTLKDAENYIYTHAGKNLRIASPLGLGKPNQLLNNIYLNAKADPSIRLTLFTALSLDIPHPKSELEARFVNPFYERHFGADYPRLAYTQDLNKSAVPSNIRIHEFYFQAGTMINSPQAQRNYISLNYTHAIQGIYNLNINTGIVLIAKDTQGRYSLSSNPDLTLDLRDLYNKNQKKLQLIGVVHPDLPFMGGDAIIDADFFDAIVETDEIKHELFATPRLAIDPTEHAIGLHASRMIADDGTLQIGIGSMSDALVNAMILRDKKNSLYKHLVQTIDQTFNPPLGVTTHSDIFSKGIYGTSEMIMDSFMHLRKAGILKRYVYDHDHKDQRYLHGAFYLGSKDFYEWLRTLDEDEFRGISMTRVSKINSLYGKDEYIHRTNRKNARFVNTTMQMSLLGEAYSETLENGVVVSGVGGQYNFVAMAHELSDAHSLLLLPSTRYANGKRTSNIVWSPSRITIPRHLRDIVITEYGIANLRGQTDENCIKRLLMICDSEFQEDLLSQAKQSGKISQNWEIPGSCRNNHPEKIRNLLKLAPRYFSSYPFGSDFTESEQLLSAALKSLKDQSRLKILPYIFKGLRIESGKFQRELERMNLDKTSSFKQKIYQKIVLGALADLQ